MYRHDDNINRNNAQIILHLLQHGAKQMGRCHLRIWFRNVEVSDTSGDAMKYNSRLHKKILYMVESTFVVQLQGALVSMKHVVHFHFSDEVVGSFFIALQYYDIAVTWVGKGFEMLHGIMKPAHQE